MEWIYNLQLINSLNTELNPICHLLAFLGAHHILHISRIRVNRSGSLTTRVLENSCKVKVVCMHNISSYCVWLEYVFLKGQ